MMNTRKSRLPMASAIVASLMVSAAVQAAVPKDNWNGLAGDNNFNTAGNWSTGAVPDSTYEAVLVNVTSGTRTIVLTSPTTTNKLTMTQTTAGATNKFQLNADFTLLNGNVGGADANNAAGNVIDLNSHAISFTGGSGATFYANVNMNGDGSTIENPRVFSGPLTSSSTYTFYGAVNVTGNAYMKQNFQSTNQSSAWTGPFNVNFNRTLNLTSGSLSIQKMPWSQTGSNDTFVTFNSAANLAAGTSLNISNDTASGTGNSAVTLTNNDTTTQSGTVKLMSRSNGAAEIKNAAAGTWIIAGSGAAVQRGSTIANATAPGKLTNTGMLQGSGVADTLTYTSLLTGGTLPAQRLNLINDGTIAAGNGSGSAASVGTLTLAGVDLTVSATGKINLDLGNVAGGEYDVLSLMATSAASAGVLTLASGSTLNVNLLDSYDVTQSFSIALINYGSLSAGSTFTNVLIDGQALDPSYQLTYGDSALILQHIAAAPAPEPATFGMLALAAGALLMRRSGSRKA